MKTAVILFLVFLCVSSCMLNEDELTKLRTDYTGTEFKIGGCYVHRFDNNTSDYYFFYRNGIRLIVRDSSDIDSVGQLNLRSAYNYRSHWAIFSVDKNTITSTLWDENNVSTFVITSIDTKKDYFKIENDSTLSTVDEDNGTLYYHFRKFVPKPDSVNQFIK